jgi:Na+/melibiose symporter-like transporter
MLAVPSYLRWIAALSTGITAQLIFTLVTYPLGTDSTTTTSAGQEVLAVNGVTIALTLVNALLSMSAALWVNNWILRRYPVER